MAMVQIIAVEMVWGLVCGFGAEELINRKQSGILVFDIVFF